MLGDERVAIGVVGGFGASDRRARVTSTTTAGSSCAWESARGPCDGARSSGSPKVWRDAGLQGPDLRRRRARSSGRSSSATRAFSATCALLERTIRRGARRASTRSACRGELRRGGVRRRPAHCGITLELRRTPSSTLARSATKIPNARPSMLLDLMAQRRCEIDVINGAVPAAARAVGLEAPVNETVTALVEGQGGPPASAARGRPEPAPRRVTQGLTRTAPEQLSVAARGAVPGVPGRGETPRWPCDSVP